MDHGHRHEHITGDKDRGPAGEQPEHERQPAEEFHKGNYHACDLRQRDSQLVHEAADVVKPVNEELLSAVHQKHDPHHDAQNREPCAWTWPTGFHNLPPSPPECFRSAPRRQRGDSSISECGSTVDCQLLTRLRCT